MKSKVQALLAGIVLLGGLQIASAETVVIAPEQETVIREYVKKKPIASIDLPGVELNIGSTVPDPVRSLQDRRPDGDLQLHRGWQPHLCRRAGHPQDREHPRLAT